MIPQFLPNRYGHSALPDGHRIEGWRQVLEAGRAECRIARIVGPDGAPMGRARLRLNEQRLFDVLRALEDSGTVQVVWTGGRFYARDLGPLRTRVVNMRRSPCDVRIDRKGPWGNPFEIGKDGNRRTVVLKHAAWIRGEIAAPARGQRRWKVPGVRAIRAELAWFRLGCWCRPQLCHGTFLAAIADGGDPRRVENLLGQAVR